MRETNGSVPSRMRAEALLLVCGGVFVRTICPVVSLSVVGPRPRVITTGARASVRLRDSFRELVFVRIYVIFLFPPPEKVTP